MQSVTIYDYMTDVSLKDVPTVNLVICNELPILIPRAEEELSSLYVHLE